MNVSSTNVAWRLKPQLEKKNLPSQVAECVDFALVRVGGLRFASCAFIRQMFHRIHVNKPFPGDKQSLTPMIPSSTTTASISSTSVAVHVPASQPTLLIDLYSFFLGFSVLVAIAYTFGMRHGRRAKLQETISLLEQRGKMERIFQTHYWSQDYRTQDASEDYRSGQFR